MATAQISLDSAEQAFIDQVIAKQAGRPGELLGILEAVQERNPHKYLSPETLRYIAGQARHSAVADLQRGDLLCAVQPGAAGRQHHLHLPRHRVPHPQLARPAGEPAAGARPGIDDGEESNDADKLTLTTADKKFTVRTVACFGQCALAPVVEVNHRICGHVNERTLQREVRSLEREND